MFALLQNSPEAHGMDDEQLCPDARSVWHLAEPSQNSPLQQGKSELQLSAEFLHAGGPHLPARHIFDVHSAGPVQLAPFASVAVITHLSATQVVPDSQHVFVQPVEANFTQVTVAPPVPKAPPVLLEPPVPVAPPMPVAPPVVALTPPVPVVPLLDAPPMPVAPPVALTPPMPVAPLLDAPPMPVVPPVAALLDAPPMAGAPPVAASLDAPPMPVAPPIPEALLLDAEEPPPVPCEVPPTALVLPPLPLVPPVRPASAEFPGLIVVEFDEHPIVTKSQPFATKRAVTRVRFAIER